MYIIQPNGFTSKRNANKECKLQRSIYGIKQASQSWDIRFDETIKEYDFIKNLDDSCIYKKVNVQVVAFLVLYADNILLIGNDIPMLQAIKPGCPNNSP